MSGPTAKKAELGPPNRWLKCPRRGQVVAGKFLPFKTPLCSLYDSQIPEEDRFSVGMVFAGHKVGLWIDLTNTDRFYSQEDVENAEAKYVKLNCKGHDERPSPDQTNLFIQICKSFFRSHPSELVGVHCTHGFNRTGFLIVSYLVIDQDWSVEAAITEFSGKRPPGIYKQDYLDELFTRYGDSKDTFMAPARPDWCDEHNIAQSSSDMVDTASTSKSSKGRPEFVEGVPDVTPVEDISKVRRIQRLCQEWCAWKRSGFPGSQPVSMDMQNLGLLQQKLYKVSWKADGVRYMMLIDGVDEVYMIDRDNNVFQVPRIRFPHRKESNRDIKQTLVDGEMIFDEVDGKKFPRYLIYDIVRFEGQTVGHCDFDLRTTCIRREIIDPRQKAKQDGVIDPRVEPFSVRIKDFWDIMTVEKILSDKFRVNGAHEVDGLIFQPVPDPYEPGRCYKVLKWKPHELNSVDFKLKIVKEQGVGMLPEMVGYLYVLHHPHAIGKIKVTKELRQYDNKIIECSFDAKVGWKFMRERRDKSFPNAYNTYQGVCRSIAQPITKDLLIDFVKTKAVKPRPMKRPMPDGSNDDQQQKRSAIDGGNGPDHGLMPPPPAPVQQ